MYKTIALTFTMLATVATMSVARAQTPPPSAANPGRGLMVMAPGCSFQFHAGRARGGDNIPASMSLRNTGQWCLGTISVSGVSSSGAHIVDQPRHGELRMKIVDGGILFIYRPGAGYQGSDRFLIEVPGGAGYDYNLAASVTVEP